MEQNLQLTSRVIALQLPSERRPKGTQQRFAQMSFDGNVLMLKAEGGQTLLELPRSEISSFTSSAGEFVVRTNRRPLIVGLDDGHKTNIELGTDILEWPKILKHYGIHKKSVFRSAGYVLFGFFALLTLVFPVLGIVGWAGLLYLIVTHFTKR